jgi:signal transduction histidine kinase
MWILSKHLNRSELYHAQLESLVSQRTAALQNLSQRLLKVQDEERRGVARDLHDSTGQTLTALKMGLAVLMLPNAVSRKFETRCSFAQFYLVVRVI